MKLKDYLKALNEQIKANKNLLELEVIHASDDEGNFFHKVFYTPTAGKFEDGAFISETDSNKQNAICLN